MSIRGKYKNQEEMDVLRVLESVLKKRRKYIFQIPNPASRVILMMSGGIDSIVCWAMLMKKYKLKVHPVFLIRGKRFEEKREERSIDHYQRLFEKKYPEEFVRVHKLKVAMPEFSNPYRDLIAYLHPQVILDNLDEHGSLKKNFSLGHFSLFPFMGFMHAKFLNARENFHVNTIFCGTTFSDGSTYRTLTASRSVMLTLGLLSGENDWQYSSVAYDPELNASLTKADLVRWAETEGISLDQTWTCISQDRLHCGECLPCLSRRAAFDEALVADKTRYKRKSWVNPSNVKRMIKQVGISLIPSYALKNKGLSVGKQELSEKYESPVMSKLFLRP